MIRKFAILLLATSFLLASSFAQPPDTSRMPQRGPHMQCPPMGGGQGMGACSMLMRPRVYPTQDGGFLVVIGNRLVKYDQNLSRKQTATIELSEEQMQQMLNQMRQMMDMCREMVQDTMPQDTSG
ncbi:MAG: hypothetical protein ACLFQB_05885 [Chitinispirillaceae bacterium]